MKTICNDCRQIRRGCKKIIAIEMHYSFSKYPEYMDNIVEREKNLRGRLDKYVCKSCRNWATGWTQGIGNTILITKEGTRESFRSKWDKEHYGYVDNYTEAQKWGDHKMKLLKNNDGI